jgi:hypothetical protein
VENTGTSSSASNLEDEGPRISRDSWMLVPPKRERPPTTPTSSETDEEAKKMSITVSATPTSSSSTYSSSESKLSDWRSIAPRSSTKERGDESRVETTTRPR